MKGQDRTRKKKGPSRSPPSVSTPRPQMTVLDPADRNGNNGHHDSLAGRKAPPPQSKMRWCERMAFAKVWTVKSKLGPRMGARCDRLAASAAHGRALSYHTTQGQ